MSFATRLIIALGFALASMGQAVAGEAAAGQAVAKQGSTPIAPKQVALTSASVENVIQVLPKLITLTKNYKGPRRGGPPKTGPNTPALDSKEFQAFTAILKGLSGKHGFKDLRTMQNTVETTMLTTGFIKSGRTLKSLHEQIAATRKMIENNPKLNAQQKQMMLQRMNSQIALIIPSPENINIVRPFVPRIMAITGKK